MKYDKLSVKDGGMAQVFSHCLAAHYWSSVSGYDHASLFEGNWEYFACTLLFRSSLLPLYFILLELGLYGLGA